MIERVIAQVLASVPVSTGDDLSGFWHDADEFLGRQFCDAVVRSTNDPACLIDARATLDEEVTSLQDVGSRLKEIWDAIAYSAFEASSFSRYREASVFRFVTVITGDVFCVTGRIVVSGGPYERLADKFERDFHRLDPLPTRHASAWARGSGEGAT